MIVPGPAPEEPQAETASDDRQLESAVSISYGASLRNFRNYCTQIRNFA